MIDIKYLAKFIARKHKGITQAQAESILKDVLSEIKEKLYNSKKISIRGLFTMWIDIVPPTDYYNPDKAEFARKDYRWQLKFNISPALKKKIKNKPCSISEKNH